ncbi:DUF4258 domain-containing protein [Candidatus Woesearchaeota archaeon]|nr:DUF4258 domain-containing protein [Candidatus Woesearchaeota archaeon]
MEIQYTTHAKEQLMARKIMEVWIEETIKYPTYAVHIGYKYYAIRKLNGFTLKVVYTKENYIKVITAYFIS